MNSQAPTSGLPISNFISRLNQKWDEELFRTLIRQIVSDQLGVQVTNLRAPLEGRVTSTKAEPLNLGVTMFGDGKSRLLAFADPPLFRGRYGDKFNAEMTGFDVFKSALANQDCVGVLVNGALSAHTVAIDRAAIQWVLGSPTQPPIFKKAWWRLWW